MEWNWLKKQIERLCATSLKNRVSFCVVKHRDYTGEYGRAVLLIDGEEACTFSDFEYERAGKKELIRIHQDSPETETSSSAVSHLIERTLHEQGLYRLDDFYATLEDYLCMPIEEAFASSDLIIRIMLVLDRRNKKRRLKKLKSLCSEVPVLKRLYDLRCSAEGLGL